MYYVGGKSKVEMKQLKAAFEAVGMRDVRTYSNSGNGMMCIMGTPAYRQVTVRNCNTVRKLFAMAEDSED